MAYIANTPDDVRVMLGAIGIGSIDELFDMIPPEFRLDRPLAIPPALGEMELTAEVGARLGENLGGDARRVSRGGIGGDGKHVVFAGGGNPGAALQGGGHAAYLAGSGVWPHRRPSHRDGQTG